jgi:hypothetical protein
MSNPDIFGYDVNSYYLESGEEVYELPELWLTVVVASADSLAVSFKVYEMESQEPVQYRSKDTDDYNPVSSPEEAEVFLSGAVKWDGCSDWHFDEQDTWKVIQAYHRGELLNIGKVMAFCWDLAKLTISEMS